MTQIRKIFLSFLILLYPAYIFAQGIQQHQNKDFFDFLLTPRYIIVFLMTVVFIILLFTQKIDSKGRVIVLAVSFLLFGVISYFINSFMISPSPVCATTKPFWMGARPQFFATLAVIGVLSIIASKGFCGIACPIGALQEIFYKIPVLKKFKRKKLPFIISNSIRIGIAVLFFIVILATGKSIYEYINMFDLLHWEFSLPLIDLIVLIAFLVIMLGLSLFIYRPFCYLICPMGLLTWILEHISIYKVRLKKENCTYCKTCVIESPCPSVEGIIEGNKLRGDCHLCNICIESCPNKALYFGTK
ncbi:MAG: 4Fe-4S binding protein [Ignavibacteria bacterium]|nr:4Fe-4S binding protein [Ignavibacteria bacterium]